MMTQMGFLLYGHFVLVKTFKWNHEEKFSRHVPKIMTHKDYKTSIESVLLFVSWKSLSIRNPGAHILSDALMFCVN